MTWGFSRVMGKGSWSSAAKPSSGDSVPDVSSTQRTLAAARIRMATPAPKHQYDSVGVGRDPCKGFFFFSACPIRVTASVQSLYTDTAAAHYEL